MVTREIDGRNEIQVTTTMPDLGICAEATTSIHDVGHNSTELGSVPLGQENSIPLVRSTANLAEPLPLNQEVSGVEMVKGQYDSSKAAVPTLEVRVDGIIAPRSKLLSRSIVGGHSNFGAKTG